MVREVKAVDSGPAICSFCQKVCKTRSGLKCHITRLHKAKDERKAGPDDPIWAINAGKEGQDAKLPYTCEICSRGFKSKRGLAGHKAKMHKQSPVETPRSENHLPQERKDSIKAHCTWAENVRRGREEAKHSLPPKVLPISQLDEIPCPTRLEDKESINNFLKDRTSQWLKELTETKHPDELDRHVNNVLALLVEKIRQVVPLKEDVGHMEADSDCESLDGKAPQEDTANVEVKDFKDAELHDDPTPPIEVSRLTEKKKRKRVSLISHLTHKLKRLNKIRKKIESKKKMSGRRLLLVVKGLRRLKVLKSKKMEKLPSRRGLRKAVRKEIKSILIRRRKVKKQSLLKRKKNALLKLYWQNPKECWNAILDPTAEGAQCEIPTDEVYRFFRAEAEGLSSTEPPISLDLPPWTKELEDSRPRACRLAEDEGDPFNLEEFRRTLSQGSNQSTPGWDMVTYKLIKKLPGWWTWLLAVFEECRRRSHIPPSWKTGHVKLLYKKGDPNDCGNWRPICLQSVLY